MMELSPKATLILADGEKPSLGLFKRFFDQKTNLIALDGASPWLMSHGFMPDLVIGDMDGVNLSDLKKLSSIVIHDQESNDLEKALRHCQGLQLNEISLLGAFGLRADHFLTNIAVLSRFAHLNITLFDDRQCAFICPLGQILTLSLPLGSFISFFPLGDSVGPIWSSGVDYPLNGESLSITGRLGTLNRTNEQKVTLMCESGSLLIILPNCFVNPKR